MGQSFKGNVCDKVFKQIANGNNNVLNIQQHNSFLNSPITQTNKICSVMPQEPQHPHPVIKTLMKDNLVNMLSSVR